MKLDFSLLLCTKINAKWIKYLNVRAKSIKSLRKHRSKSLWLWIDLTLICYIWHQKHKQPKKKINWIFIKKKSFRASKDTIKKLRRQFTELEEKTSIIASASMLPIEIPPCTNSRTFALRPSLFLASLSGLFFFTCHLFSFLFVPTVFLHLFLILCLGNPI